MVEPATEKIIFQYYHFDILRIMFRSVIIAPIEIMPITKEEELPYLHISLT